MGNTAGVARKRNRRGSSSMGRRLQEAGADETEKVLPAERNQYVLLYIRHEGKAGEGRERIPKYLGDENLHHNRAGSSRPPKEDPGPENHQENNWSADERHRKD